jgi:hypothetical protein
MAAPPATATTAVSPAATTAGASPSPIATSALLREAIALRAQGPEGLDRFLKQHPQPKGDRRATTDWRSALDALCQQKDCASSQLYWYTDLAQAKAAAAKTGKPILSLHLLGRLDQDLSCANSRFFRIALYPNAQVSQTLRDRYILHWQSVRPAPQITIDFGDGRKLQRTITGNSIHYFLDGAGRPLDALPGLYGPQAFSQQLDRFAQTYPTYRQQPASGQTQWLQAYHRDRLNALQQQWQADLKAIEAKAIPTLQALPLPTATDANTAGRIAVTKSVVETPLVRSVLGSPSTEASANIQSLSQATTEALWQALAQRPEAQQAARMDAGSLALMRTKLGPEAIAQLPAMVQQFQAAMALDSLRNEYLLHSRLHQWLMEAPPAGNGSAVSLRALNDRVYKELFLTPKSDPWLGLVPDNAFSGLDDNGLSNGLSN